jgi:hypothetical protein
MGAGRENKEKAKGREREISEISVSLTGCDSGASTKETLQ